MSGRLTPETDATLKEQAKWMRPFVSTTFDGITYDSPVAALCRKFERERDEAREELQKLEGAYEDATNYYARIIELREELDQVKEELKNKTYDKLKS
jgi:predicted ribosome quality control (RQC) complex YloA/Tae2 family protein